MKIGVDVRVLMDKQYSGISKYLAHLLAEVLRLDKDNEYRLFYNSFKDISGRMKTWKRGNAELIATRYPNKVFNYFLQKMFCCPKLDRVLGGVDVFWSPHFNFSSISVGAKKIITVHDLSFLRYPEFFSARKNFWHKCLKVKKAIREADAVIAVSQNTKNDIVELVGIGEEKVRVIYSGNNAKKISLDDEDRKKFDEKFRLEKPFILYLGNIEPRKNIANLIKAYNELRNQGREYKDWQLILAGAPAWKNKKIFSQWNKSDYKESIRFLGYIDDVEKEILYEKAGLFVYPSFYEGFGFPPLEAMSRAVPVICSNTSSLPEVVGGGALTINPFKVEEITDAMKLVIKDGKFRERLVVSGKSRSEDFSWQKTAEEYLKLFKEICEQ